MRDDKWFFLFLFFLFSPSPLPTCNRVQAQKIQVDWIKPRARGSAVCVCLFSKTVRGKRATRNPRAAAAVNKKKIRALKVPGIIEIRQQILSLSLSSLAQVRL